MREEIPSDIIRDSSGKFVSTKEIEKIEIQTARQVAMRTIWFFATLIVLLFALYSFV